MEKIECEPPDKLSGFDLLKFVAKMKEGLVLSMMIPRHMLDNSQKIVIDSPAEHTEIAEFEVIE